MKALNFVKISILFIVSNEVFAGGHAKISGSDLISFAGEISPKEIILENEKCILRSEGKPDTNNLKIILNCKNISQILWDIAVDSEKDLSFDEAPIRLLWAGDKDNDGKIDVELELSPKYSCSKKVLFLSSKAKPNKLVGISGSPTLECGD